MEDTSLKLVQELANLVGRALALIEERTQQALKIGAYRNRDGGWRIAVETHDEIFELLDALLDDGFIIRFIVQRHGNSFRRWVAGARVDSLSYPDAPHQYAHRTASTAVRR